MKGKTFWLGLLCMLTVWTICLVGCTGSSSGTNTSETGSSASEDTLAEEADSASRDYVLDSDIVFQGLTVSIDRGWTVEEHVSPNTHLQVGLYIKPVASEYWNHISIQTSLYSDTRDVQTAFDAYNSSSRPITVINEWNEGEVFYQTGLRRFSNDDGDFADYYLVGYEEGSGKGFVMELQLGSNEWPEEIQQKLFEDLLETVSYDPQGTVIDYYEAYTGKPHDTEEGGAQETAAATSMISTEDATRALVVGCNNVWATDVFASDGNTYDVSRFHHFGDTDGDYFVLVSEGSATQVDDNTVRLAGVEVDSYTDGAFTNTTYTLAGTVTFDGECYILTDVSMEFYTPTAQPGYQSGDYPILAGDENVVFRITPDLIGK